MFSDVQVKCKQCNRSAKSTEFVLDPVYGKMVCEACVKERKTSEGIKRELAVQKAAKQVEEKKKPAGWDAEDEYLAKQARKKAEETPVPVKKIDAERVKIQCAACKYEFVYNKVKQTPGNCPYCGKEVFRKKF
ncbi:MAG: hypothetical protein ABIA37_00435 [Candidatus Woesearchaeota archaeon]